MFEEALQGVAVRYVCVISGEPFTEVDRTLVEGVYFIDTIIGCAIAAADKGVVVLVSIERERIPIFPGPFASE